ncbi:nidogen isoform X2 [Anabrus simplex]|uniref:nidogen isoform X2 n=1 Tax=Anabrus simplex TaxID=316456 RepID=UPI0034DD19FC
MYNSRPLLLLLGVLIALVSVARALPKSRFYDYGPALDKNLQRDEHDTSSPEIQLTVPIVFYGETYRSIFVNTNGLLSFLTDIPVFFNIQFPLDYPVIAPLYTNVDTRERGTVYYRETQDPQLLDRAAINIRDAFSAGQDFTPKSLFIATWDDVGYFDRGSDKANSFQAVIISDGSDSYVELLYAEDGIQWIQGSGHESGLPDARAQAGLVSGDGRMYTLKGSGTDQIQYLDKWSNTGVPGMWIFHIGQMSETGNVMPPDLEIEGQDSLESTCEARGSTTCHSKAQCTDYEEGFCCSCQSGFYGNGLSCLMEGIPLRVNGKMTGNINEVDLSQVDVQSYVVTPDGRTYTAVSRVPETIGFDMQILNILGGVIGWLFARPIKNAMNGYQLTGGVFQHTAEITFPQTGHKVTLKQNYLGLDVFDQLKLEAEIHGSIPAVPFGTRIQISEYEEHYTRTAPGIIQSQSSQSFRLEGVPVDNPFSVEQTIKYEECAHHPVNISTLRLKVARNLITYEAKEKIIRYGMTSKVTPLEDVDPCNEGRHSCVEHSSCVVEGDSFHCVCNPGYQYLYAEYETQDSPSCVDINECSSGIHDCDSNAICVNEPGSYSCRCNAGFSGNGQTCTKLLSCEDLSCDEHADCIERYPGHFQCQCLPGYTGNGITCTSLSSQDTCDIANNCSPFATCYYNENTGSHACACLPGYQGDGYSCVDDTLLNNTDWAPSPTCLLGVCWCPSEYEIIGSSCVLRNETGEEEGNEHLEPRPEPACFTPTKCFCPKGYVYQQEREMCDPVPGASSLSHGTMGATGTKLACNIVNTCHPYAQCVYSATQRRFQCQCNAGYEGDGYDCNELDVSCLDVDICDIHASCVRDETTEKYVCRCNPGYQWDGSYCAAVDECTSAEDCPAHASCTWSYQFKHYQCMCDENFVMQGEECVPDKGSGCKILNDCHSNAQCVYNPQLDEYACECNAGYSGDGKSCVADPIGCNVLNNCGHGADCVYDQKSAGYRCKCRQGLRGNGTVCAPESSCQDNPGLCGRGASCVVGPDGYHICQCNEGFTGNGAICRPLSRHEGNFLLLNQGMATLRVPFNPTRKDRGRPIAIKPYQEAVGIDVDCLEGRVYWSDITGKVIRSAKYNGANITNFISKDLGSLEGLSIDWVSRNIYWTDSSKDTIEVANLDSKLRKVLISDGLVNPRGIAVHPTRGKVFWSDWDRNAPKLEWANLDGSGRSVFLTGPSIHLPNSLAIDWDTDELCWADAGTKTVECIGIDYGVRRTVASNCSYPFGLAISRENYYWTDWKTQKIESAAKPYGQKNQSLTVPLGGNGKLYGIVAVPEQCPRSSNACQFENGQCGEGRLCLPNGAGSRSCVCADADEEGSGEAAICNDIL